MKTAICLSLLFIQVILLTVLIFPFIPGSYDPLSVAMLTVVQLFSALGLLTVIPAILWLYQVIKHAKVTDNNSLLIKGQLYPKIYFWTFFIVLLIVVLVTTFAISKLLGIFLFISQIFFARLIWKKLSQPKPGVLSSFCLPLGLVLLPVLLFIFPFLIDGTLTSWSRSRAINNSSELIDEIERYKVKYGKYPLTLNAIWKDYETGITGIEKYHYTYDDTSFNLYFEQPRFLFDQFGTREFVVYNPKDNHVILSHASWNMHFEPHQLRQNQGWYTSFNTGIPHWKYFWFD